MSAPPTQVFIVLDHLTHRIVEVFAELSVAERFIIASHRSKSWRVHIRNVL